MPEINLPEAQQHSSPTFPQFGHPLFSLTQHSFVIEFVLANAAVAVQ